MPRYRLLIRGQNLLIDFGDGFEKSSFYTPRYVDAIDQVLAESTALEDFFHSEKYHNLISEIENTIEDRPQFTVEDIEECDDNEDFDNGIVPGMAFYTEEDT
jgi:hypothetical protein